MRGGRLAHDAGVIHVSITHNDNANLARYPGAYKETITIGATDQLDHSAAPFCYRGPTGRNPRFFAKRKEVTKRESIGRVRPRF